jgi:hypothetical protein
VVEESAEAYRAIGAYFCAFSALERELGETIKVIFRLGAHEARETIVAALGDVSKKINPVWAASQLAKRADGSDTPKDWKENADKTMAAIWECNGDRNQLAHSFLEPKADGSVELKRLRLGGGELRGADDPNKWTQDNFKTKLARLSDLTRQLQNVKDHLSEFKITIPDDTWMRADPFRPKRPPFSAALWEQLSSAPKDKGGQS